MSVYYDSISFEAELAAGVWTDLTADVIQKAGVTGFQGIKGSGPLDRVAEAGQCTFTLRNDARNSAGLANYYTPGHVNCLEGFEAGKYVRCVITYLEREYTVWYGKIIPGGIKIYSDPYAQKVSVTSRDYMEELAIHEMYLPEFTQNKRADEIAPLILANLHVQPDDTQFYEGSTTFGTVFDTVRPRTRALAELQKLALSEWGYFYTTITPGSPEVFVGEGRLTRNDYDNLFQVSFPSEVKVKRLLMTTGGVDADPRYLTTELGLRLLLDTNPAGDLLQDAEFDNSARSITVEHARDFYNSIRVISYPRQVDADATTILFELQRPIQILAGEIKTITGRFRDPNAGASRISGIDMAAPVASTHYQMSENEDGTGTDLTANLTVDRIYGADGFEDTLENTGGTPGWVTKLTAVGRGVYIYDSVERTYEDADNISEFGLRQITLDMKYLDNPLIADDFGGAVLDQLGFQRTFAEKVSFIANRTSFLLSAFLQIPIGAKIYLRDDPSGVDAEFFVQGREFQIRPGGVIEYGYWIRPASLDTYTFWFLGVMGESELGLNTFLGF